MAAPRCYAKAFMLSKSIPLAEDVTELLTRAKALAHELQPAAATRMVEQARQVAASSGQTEAQAEVEIVAAWLSLRHGDSQSANEHAEAALLLSNLSGDALMQADAHLISARVASSHGDLDQTMVDLGMAQVKCLGTQHAPLRFHIENMLGIVHNDARQPHVSTAHFQNAQHIAQAAGLADLEAVAAANGAGVWLEIGIAAEASGDLQAAQAAWQRAVKANDEAQLLAERSNTQRAMLVIANNRSAALAHLGRLDEADQGLETAQKLAHHAPDATLTIYTALQRCRLHLRKGELAQARDAAEQGIEAAKSAGANGQLIDLYMAT
jgi:tetratricopeptide (TPR) repeat protein